MHNIMHAYELVCMYERILYNNILSSNIVRGVFIL